MENQLITFETAQFAKEKGFNIPTEHYSIKERPENVFSARYDDNESDYNWNEREGISVPTQSLLQCWLREIHNLHISLAVNQFGYGFMYAITDHVKCQNIIELKGGPNNKYSYEEALEVGLFNALKLIKN